ncbi:MAG: hypothetical protein ACYCOU_07525 [Sulfobacillus sp.]
MYGYTYIGDNAFMQLNNAAYIGTSDTFDVVMGNGKFITATNNSFWQGSGNRYYLTAYGNNNLNELDQSSYYGANDSFFVYYLVGSFAKIKGILSNPPTNSWVSIGNNYNVNSVPGSSINGFFVANNVSFDEVGSNYRVQLLGSPFANLDTCDYQVSGNSYTFYFNATVPTVFDVVNVAFQTSESSIRLVYIGDTVPSTVKFLTMSFNNGYPAIIVNNIKGIIEISGKTMCSPSFRTTTSDRSLLPFTPAQQTLSWLQLCPTARQM